MSSSMIFGSVSASLRMAPVQGAQPSERMRTFIVLNLLAGKQLHSSCTNVSAPPRIVIGRSFAK